VDNGIWPSAPCNAVIASVRAGSRSNSRWKMLAKNKEAYAAEQSSWCNITAGLMRMVPVGGRERPGEVHVAAEHRVCACLIWRCFEQVEGLYFLRADALEKTS
jgi:hypothetical protein